MPHVRRAAVLWRNSIQSRRNYVNNQYGGAMKSFTVPFPIARDYQEMLALADGDRRLADLIDFQEAVYMADETEARRLKVRQLAAKHL